MELSDMSVDERSLLIYLETREVDYGRVDARHISIDDFNTIERWTATGFIQFGRIASEYITRESALWVNLSDEAWRLAHEERRARAKRIWGKRGWTTTDEKRASNNPQLSGRLRGDWKGERR